MSGLGAGMVWGSDEKGPRLCVWCVCIRRERIEGNRGAFLPSRAASRLIGALVAPLPLLLKHVTDDKRKQH